MKTFLRALTLVRAYWYVPFFALACVLAWAFTRRSPTNTVEVELAAIRAGLDAKRWQEELGAEKARDRVRDAYRTALAALNKEQAAKARELENDPQALAYFLVRAGAGQ